MFSFPPPQHQHHPHLLSYSTSALLPLHLPSAFSLPLFTYLHTHSHSLSLFFPCLLFPSPAPFIVLFALLHSNFQRPLLSLCLHSLPSLLPSYSYSLNPFPTVSSPTPPSSTVHTCIALIHLLSSHPPSLIYPRSILPPSIIDTPFSFIFFIPISVSPSLLLLPYFTLPHLLPLSRLVSYHFIPNPSFLHRAYLHRFNPPLIFPSSLLSLPPLHPPSLHYRCSTLPHLPHSHLCFPFSFPSPIFYLATPSTFFMPIPYPLSYPLFVSPPCFTPHFLPSFPSSPFTLPMLLPSSTIHTPPPLFFSLLILHSPTSFPFPSLFSLLFSSSPILPCLTFYFSHAHPLSPYLTHYLFLLLASLHLFSPLFPSVPSLYSCSFLHSPTLLSPSPLMTPLVIPSPLTPYPSIHSSTAHLLFHILPLPSILHPRSSFPFSYHAPSCHPLPSYSFPFHPLIHYSYHIPHPCPYLLLLLFSMFLTQPLLSFSSFVPFSLSLPIPNSLVLHTRLHSPPPNTHFLSLIFTIFLCTLPIFSSYVPFTSLPTVSSPPLSIPPPSRLPLASTHAPSSSSPPPSIFPSPYSPCPFSLPHPTPPPLPLPPPPIPHFPPHLLIVTPSHPRSLIILGKIGE